MSPRQLQEAEQARKHFAKARATMDRTKTVGAKSEQFATKPGFFNIIYSHPLFGAMPEWGGQTWEPPPGPLTPRAPLPLPKVKSRKVPASTDPWVRLPPHTAHQKAKYEAMYGLSPRGKAERHRQENAALTLQTAERGRRARSPKSASQ